MISISIFKTTPNDDMQSIAATKLEEMILTNVEMLIDQLDDGQNIGDHVQVIITDQQFVAEQSGMVFVLSDILDQQKTQRIFDQIDMKTKILIDLDPENKNDWKCGTYASSSVKSCFESRKNMSIKEMLIKVLYNHNKKNNHFETRALLLSALALGLECYNGGNKSEFCSKLMSENSGQLISKAYSYDMKNRSLTVIDSLAWVMGLGAYMYTIYQTSVFGVIAGSTFIPALLTASIVAVTSVALMKLVLWLKQQVQEGMLFEHEIHKDSGVLWRLWNYLRGGTKANSITPSSSTNHASEHLIEIVNGKSIDGIPVIKLDESTSSKIKDINKGVQTIWTKAIAYFGEKFNSIAWIFLSIVFKIPAWVKVLGIIGAKGILTKSGWTRLFKIVDIGIEKGNLEMETNLTDETINKHILGSVKYTSVLAHGFKSLALACLIAVMTVTASPLLLSMIPLLFVMDGIFKTVEFLVRKTKNGSVVTSVPTILEK